MTVTAELASILQTTEKNLNARLVGLRIAPVCNRCGGSGRHSFNQTDGTRCWGCGGSGFVAPSEKDLPALVEDAKNCVADGRLADYLLFLEARKTTLNAQERILAAWQATDISAAYDWRKVSTNADHREISIINAKMADAYNSVARVYLNSASPTYREDIIALAALVKTALASVAAADAEFKTVMAARKA